MERARIWVVVGTLALVAASCSLPSPTETVAASSAAVEDLVPEQLATSLVECNDIPQAESSMQGLLPGLQSPDDLLMGVLYTYGQENPDSFADLWIDRDNNGTIVVAFTDDPEPHRSELLTRGPKNTDVQLIEPRIPITDDRPLGERDDFVFDVVQLEFTLAELEATQDGLLPLLGAEGTGVQSTGRDTLRNRVSVGLIDPTPEGLEFVAEAVAGLPVCVDITMSPEPPAGRLQIIPEPGEPFELPLGLGQAGWRLDPSFPDPQPADTEIHVLVTELGCASGRDPGDDLSGPEVVETETEILIAFAVVPVPGDSDCPSNPSTAVTVTLPSPLGDRTVRNGAVSRE